MTNRKLFLYYTLLFMAVAAGVFAVFVVSGKVFIQDGDGFKQSYFFLAEFKEHLGLLFSGEGLAFWSWSRGLGMPIDYHADPFALIAALFPLKYLEIGFSVAIICKLYCGGLTFLWLLREMKLDAFKSLLGSLCYTFTAWFICIGMYQSTFLTGMFLMPILIISIDWIYRGKTPILFIATVAYFLIKDAYLSYMVAIVSIVYMLLRYFTYNDQYGLKDYLLNLGRFIVYGVIGVLVAAVAIAPYALNVSGASLDSSSDELGLIYDLSFFKGFFGRLTVSGLTPGYTFFGFVIPVLLVLPLAYKRISLKNTPVIMSLLLLAGTFFPAINSMFNGFNYPSARWYFMVILFTVWAASEMFDLKELSQKRNLMAMSITLLVLVFMTLGLHVLGVFELSLRTIASKLICFSAGAAIILVIGAFRRGLLSQRLSLRHRQIATICITGIAIMACWSMSFYLYADKFMKVGEIGEILHESTQRVSGSFTDEGFYRTDQVDWAAFSHDVCSPANESIYWNAKPIYTYNSLITQEQLEFNRLLGNNYGYVARVYTLSNDNRSGLDFMQGVKYFLGDDTKNGKTGSDEYAGYGFSPVGQMDGVNIFKNKYDPGLGFAYDSYMPRSEFLKLDRLQREQALMQTMVLDDKICDSLSKDLRVLSASDLELHVSRLPYEIVETDGITIDFDNNSKLSAGQLIADHGGASFTIDLAPAASETARSMPDGSQVVLSFDNFIRKGDMTYSISCDSHRVHEVAKVLRSNQSLSKVTDFDLNMGYYEILNGKLQVTISQPGTYTFDDFRVSAMDVSLYDKYAAQRVSTKYDVTSYNHKEVIGSINVPADSLLYISLPKHDNWDVYVDGVKAERLEDVNIAYLGVELPKGEHAVRLKYNNVTQKIGLAISCLGLILMIIIGVLHRRRLT